MDVWSQIDIFCAFTNISCLSSLRFIKKEDIIDEKRKVLFNILMQATVLATWSRIIGIALVMELFSKLIIIIWEMLFSAGVFLFIVMYYLIAMSVCALALFQEANPLYKDLIYIWRAMFDNMMAAYSYDLFPSQKRMKVEHTFFMFIHIYIANIFLLNYLVAILSTVYSEMMETGEFAYNCKKYLYIERYLIAQKDNSGYTELVMHPPPINYMLIFLLPSIFNKEMMVKNSAIFSKLNFWFENIYYITEQLLYELMLVPYIYIRNMSFIATLSGLSFNCLKLLLFWIPCGLFFLLYNVFMDIINFINVLRSLKLDAGKKEELQAEYVKMDKIVLYNELIDVMKSIYFIFLKKRYQSLKTTGKIMDEVLEKKMAQMDLWQAIDLIQDKTDDILAKEDDDIIEGYTMHNDLLLEAWAHFRPRSEKNDFEGLSG